MDACRGCSGGSARTWHLRPATKDEQLGSVEMEVRLGRRSGQQSPWGGGGGGDVPCLSGKERWPAELTGKGGMWPVSVLL